MSEIKKLSDRFLKGVWSHEPSRVVAYMFITGYVLNPHRSMERKRRRKKQTIV